MTEILAIDIGYGYTKGMTRRDSAIILSQVGPAEARTYDMGIGATAGITVTVDGRKFFVGEQASIQSASASQTLDTTRTGSTEQMALFYAIASELVKTTTSALSVVTGLPVGDYNDRNKSLLREALKGEHMVKREGKRKRYFETQNVYVIPQAVGSLFALILDQHGRLINSDLADARVAIIDVGMHTTNYVLVDQLRYVEIRSDSITTGMGEMLQKVEKDLRREYGLDWSLQLGKVDQAVRERTVLVSGVPVDISTIVDSHLEPLADTILSKARSLWGAGVDLKAVVMTGGGSSETALTPLVRRVYSHARTVNGDPQFANVRGYLRAGLRRFG